MADLGYKLIKKMSPKQLIEVSKAIQPLLKIPKHLVFRIV